MRPIALLAALLLAAPVHAQPVAYPAPPQVEFEQHPGARLPLRQSFVDDSGRRAPLRTFFDTRPVVLVLGYYRCPNLCSTLMDGVLEALADVRLPADSYRVLGVSIDPSETADIAARKKASYAPLLQRAGAELHLLTGREQPIRALAASTGIGYAYDAALEQFVHPAGFLIATPEGRISRYFPGVRFDPSDVRLALVEASSGRIGSPADRLLLLCSHYDPQTGRYSTEVMTLVRAVCLLVLALLGGWVWRQRRRRT